MDILEGLGKALIEANIEEACDVIDEDIVIHSAWRQVYDNRKEVEVDTGSYKDSINHCLMDSLVLLANEEEMLKIMHQYGIQHLFEILNFQKYKDLNSQSSSLMYKSFMGDALITEKVTIV